MRQSHFLGILMIAFAVVIMVNLVSLVALYNSQQSLEQYLRTSLVGRQLLNVTNGNTQKLTEVLKNLNNITMHVEVHSN